MKNYSDLVYNQFKVNKRNIYTILGIMFGIILFTTVEYLKIFMNKVNIEYEKIHSGNYEAYFYDVNKDEVREIKNNVKIKDYGFAALESSQSINIKDIKKNILVYALDNNCIDNIFNKRMKLEEGYFPKKVGEMTLDIVAKTQLNKNIGDTIKVSEKNYKIVGFYKAYDFNPYNLMGITYFENSSNYSKLIGFINIKDKHSIRENLFELANNIGITSLSDKTVLKINDEIQDNYKTSFSLNENLIRCYENNNIFYFKNMNETKLLFLFVDLGTVFLTIILILSSINISLKEKIKYFSILRCIGATPEKIRYLLIKESLILGGLSIISGVIIGYWIVYFIINIVLGKSGKINFYGVKFSAYWSVVVTAIILVGVVILISSSISMVKARKITPIDAIKKGNFALKKVKRTNSKIIKKLFGYKSMLAYKNIRANNRNFIMTTLMISTLLISLVVFTGFYTIMFKSIKGTGRERFKDFTIQIDNVVDEEMNMNAIETIDKQFEKIEDTMKILNEMGNVKNISAYVNINLDSLLKIIKSKESFKNNTEIINGKDEEANMPNSNMYIYNDESIKEILPYIKSIKGNFITLDDFKNNGVLLINQNIKNKQLENRDKTTLGFNSNDKINMYLDISSRNSELNEIKHYKSNINVKILGTIDPSNIVDGRRNENFNGVNFIVSKDFYEKNKKIIFADEKYVGRITRVDFDLLNNKKREESLKDIKAYVNEIGGWYIDNYKYAKEQRGILLTVATIVYTAMFFAICISVVNIINNKNAGILLRKNELATMLAIGVKREYLTKIIMLEGVIQWGISMVIAGVISYITLEVIYFILSYSGELVNKESMIISVMTFVVGSLILLITNLIASVMALKNIEKFNIAEMLRSDE